MRADRAVGGLQTTLTLDQKTRDFIQGLPAEVRVQVIALLLQALPIIDTSVQSYLNQVDSILNHQITNIECSVIGAGKVLGSNFAADLKNVIPFSGQSKPEPVQSIKADRDRTIGGFSTQDAPAKYEAAYSDLLYRTAVTACQVKISAEATVDVSDVQQDVHARWLIWYRLINACPNASGCFDALMAQTTALTAKSDSRDLKAVNAIDRLSVLTKPLAPGFLSSWNPSMYEKDLEELLSLKDGIDLARVARETLAANYLTACGLIVQTAEANIKTAQASLSNTNAANNQNAIDHANAASSESEK